METTVNGATFHMNYRVYKDPRVVSITPHSHNGYELIYILEGEVSYVIEDREFRLRPYDLVITRPNKHHYLKVHNSTPYRRYNLIFDPSVFPLGEEMLPDSLEVVNCRGTAMGEVFSRLRYYLGAFSGQMLEVLTEGLLRELLCNLSLTTGNTAEPVVLSALVSEGLKYIGDNLFTIGSVKEVSDRLFVTEAYFHRAFRRQMKTSPMKYITDKRLLAAQRLIREGARPTEIYSQVGFRTYPAFFKRYVAFFGCAPSRDKGELGSFGEEE